MNRRLNTVFFFVLVAMMPVLPLRGQELTTMGKEFWFTYMDNTDRMMSGDRHRVIISSKNACSVTISLPSTGWQSSAESVVPGVATEVVMSIDLSNNQTFGSVMDKGFRLVATDTVSVYISSLGYHNYEAANVLPMSALRDEYMIQCYPSDFYGSCFAIVSTEDSTWVDIHLTSSAPSVAQAGDDFTVLLPRAGQVYQLKSDSVGDFSGTTIKSRDCKPIAVFHGDLCPYIPEYTPAGSCDHVFEQAVPTSYWGKQFVVMRSTSERNDRVRITSLENNCRIYRNGTVIATVNRGHTYEYPMESSNRADYIEATKPVTVNNYFASMGSGEGDPSMVTISPIEQMANNVTFGSFNTQATTNHKVNVVVKTEDCQLIRLDGNDVSVSFLVLQGNPDYMYATLPVSAGSHTLSMDGGKGFVAYAFGIGSHESYAYSIGSSMRKLTNSLYVDGEPVFFGNTLSACSGTPLHLKAEYDEAPDSVVWRFGDGRTAHGDSVVCTYTQGGVYSLEGIFCHSTGGCFGGSNNDTIAVNVRVFPNDTIDIDTSLCHYPFDWNGEVIREPGEYSQLFESVHGCDSLVRITLDFTQPPVTEFRHEGCDSVVYEGTVYKRNTRIYDTLQDAGGCDSILLLNIVVHQSYDYYVEYTLEEGDTMQWVDGGYYWSEEQHPYMIYTSQYGCDSIERLRLKLIPYVAPPPKDSSRIWIPNIFTPDEGTNATFKIESFDIIEMHVSIFSRNGLFITEFDGLTGEWDGTYKGQTCNQGTYVYLIEYRTKAMPAIPQKKIGTVTLIR